MSNAKTSIAMQLYSARNFAPVADQLATVARNGYTHVETFGSFNDDPTASRKLFESHGLKVQSAHIDLDIVIGDTNRAIDIASALGATYAIAPYLPEDARPNDAAGWRALGDRLQRASDLCAPHEVSVAWHNHDYEFKPLADGSLPIRHLLGERLLWEADLAWVARVGADPAAWIEFYRGRIAAVHVKDIAPPGEKTDEDGWADVGTGVMPWAELWALACEAGVKLFIAEHDNPSDFERFASVSAGAMRRFTKGEAQCR